METDVGTSSKFHSSTDSSGQNFISLSALPHMFICKKDLRKRMVTEAQIHSLMGFMRRHPELARGLSRGRRGKLSSVKLWNNCAIELNAIKDGAAKDGKGWSKYWCDWKYRVRRHALEIRAARDSNTSTEGATPLSAIEETIMAIIGDSSIDSVVVKSDPLLDEDSNDEGQAKVNFGTHRRKCEMKMRDAKRRRVSVEPTQEGDSDDKLTASPPQRAKLERNGYESEDDNAVQFLWLEKIQLENAKKIQKSISEMSLDIRKLTDIMGEIRDVLVKRLDHVT